MLRVWNPSQLLLTRLKKSAPRCFNSGGAPHAEEGLQRADRHRRQKAPRSLRKQQAQPAAAAVPPKFQARPYAATGITKKYISTKWQALPAITNR